MIAPANQIIASNEIMLAPSGAVLDVEGIDAVRLLTWPDGTSLPGVIGVDSAPVVGAIRFCVLTGAFGSLTDVGATDAVGSLRTHGAAGRTGTLHAGRIRM